MTLYKKSADIGKPKLIHHILGILAGLAVFAAVFASAYFTGLSPEEQQRLRISIGLEQRPG